MNMILRIESRGKVVKTFDMCAPNWLITAKDWCEEHNLVVYEQKKYCDHQVWKATSSYMED